MVFFYTIFVILLPNVWVFVRSAWFILPGLSSMKSLNDDDMVAITAESKALFEFITYVKYRNKIIIDAMGDTASIVIHYLGSVEDLIEENQI